MVSSQNTRVLYTTKANLIAFGLSSKHGNILVGDRAFEFYNHRNTADYLQIPYSEIKLVRAQVYFKNRYIRGFYIDTMSGGTFNFVVKNAGKTLKTMSEFLDKNKLVKNVSLFSKFNIFK